MKNISIILNIILIIAVAFLFYKVYSPAEKGPVVVSSADKSDAGIVFVYSDSLLNNYPLLKDLEKQFEDKRDSVDRVLQSRDRKLKEEFAAFEQRAGAMTEEQQQKEYEGFMRKQQTLVDLRDNLLEGLTDEQEKLQDSVHTTILNYLKEFNSSKGYDYILSYQRGSGIMLANDSLDITDEVLKGLNPGK